MAICSHGWMNGQGFGWALGRAGRPVGGADRQMDIGRVDQQAGSRAGGRVPTTASVATKPKEVWPICTHGPIQGVATKTDSSDHGLIWPYIVVVLYRYGLM